MSDDLEDDLAYANTLVRITTNLLGRDLEGAADDGAPTLRGAQLASWMLEHIIAGRLSPERYQVEELATQLIPVVQACVAKIRFKAKTDHEKQVTRILMAHGATELSHIERLMEEADL